MCRQFFIKKEKQLIKYHALIKGTVVSLTGRLCSLDLFLQKCIYAEENSFSKECLPEAKQA
jgi:hypothetical protein